ncbi:MULTISPECIES: LysR family transcriptional regulator [Aerococcus]|uniref:LysR family transcriptional regulator n=1 Tax=Aerococcus TaxID=1375 RepID=UPI0015EC1AE3|nr:MULTISPECIES: LysR family transcriptional regulator [Aerococcus]MDK6688747.1 LysR family transcriptional regulator [Aerococcus urinae]MDK8484586.1 LysR family transcriptional regulator [Aerococcus urinae]MDL5179433.1 LysR family transcriptional regulator [Aerococcus tenax]MDL5208333.1 LysR family transcriptional regulator [Aerococcus tenax]WIW72994.1 LysR family transcriptional regulator [Aerococcus tenax]
MKELNWQHLTYFIKVVECKSLTKAAAQLYLSPSTLSKAITKLEKKLRIPLIVKSGRDIQITYAGHKLAQRLVQGMTYITDSIREVQEELAQTSDSLSLSSSNLFSTTYFVIPELLKIFKEKYPQTAINYTEVLSQEVVMGVMDGSYDLACLSGEEFDPAYPGLKSIRLLKERLGILVPKDHPLAKYDSITFKQIQGETFFRTYDSEHLRHLAMEKYGRSTGDIHYNDINIRHKVMNDASIISLVQSGFGISLATKSASQTYPQVKYLAVRDMELYRETYLIYKAKAQLNPAAKDFIQLFSQKKDPLTQSISY